MGAGLSIFSIFAFIAFLIWNRGRADLDRRRLRLDAQSRILEKLGPGQALTDFLATEDGKRFFSEWVTPEAAANSGDARWKIIALASLGVIALFAGFAFLMGVAIPTALSGGPGLSRAGWLEMLPVLLLSGAGVGALVAAWIMYRLSKKWGMLGKTDSEAD